MVAVERIPLVRGSKTLFLSSDVVEHILFRTTSLQVVPTPIHQRPVAQTTTGATLIIRQLNILPRSSPSPQTLTNPPDIPGKDQTSSENGTTNHKFDNNEGKRRYHADRDDEDEVTELVVVVLGRTLHGACYAVDGPYDDELNGHDGAEQDAPYAWLVAGTGVGGHGGRLWGRRWVWRRGRQVFGELQSC
jgi:hypothetical protein